MRLVLEEAIDLDELMRCVSKSHDACPKWGFKDPWFLELPMRAMEMIDPGLIVRTWRPLEATVSSWLRKQILIGRPATETEAEQFAQTCLHREQLMDERLGLFNVLRIRFDRQVADDEIEAAIRACGIVK